MSDARSGVTRILAVLQALAENPDQGVSVRALELGTGVSRSAVQRILAKLSEEGVARLLPSGGYAAGPILYEWASKVMSRSTLLETTGAVMRELADQFDESVYLTRYLPADYEITFVHVVQCRNPLRYIVPMGSRAPLHMGAAGKVVLAWLPRETIGELPYLDEALSRARLKQLTRDLDDIQAKGYGISMGERIREVVGVSAALLLDGRPAGSVSVTIPRSRLESHSLERVGEAVNRTAARVGGLLTAHQLGWDAVAPPARPR